MREINNQEVSIPEELNLSTRERFELEVRLAEVEKKFGDGKVYNRDRLEGEIRVYAGQYSRAVIESGKRLMLLKEHEGHGNFLTCLERLEIDPRTAQNMMSLARSFVDENGNTRAVAFLPVTKLYALARLSDEEIDILEDGGEVDGLTLEEAKKMSARQLKGKVKELRDENARIKKRAAEDAEAKEQLLGEKNRKIDELDGQLRVVSDPSRWQERAEEYLMELQRLSPQFSRSISRFAEIVDWIIKLEPAGWEDSQRVLLQQANHTFGDMSECLDVIDERLRTAIPSVNAYFHSLNNLRATFPKES